MIFNTDTLDIIHTASRLDEAIVCAGLTRDMSGVFSVLSEADKAGTTDSVLSLSRRFGNIDQLDFLMRFDEESISDVISRLYAADKQKYMVLMWKIFRMKSGGRADFVKFKFKRQFAAEQKNFKHPYAMSHDAMSDFDRRLASLGSVEEIAAFSAKFFRTNGAEKISHSLFRSRVLSYDVFRLLPLDVCLKFMKMLSNNDYDFASCREIADAVFQLGDLNAKIMCLGFIKATFGYELDVIKHMPEINSLIHECGSFPEFALMCGVNDYAVFRPASFVLALLGKKPDWFAEWAESNPSEIDSVVKCSDLARIAAA